MVPLSNTYEKGSKMIEVMQAQNTLDEYLSLVEKTVSNEASGLDEEGRAAVMTLLKTLQVMYLAGLSIKEVAQSYGIELQADND